MTRRLAAAAGVLCAILSERLPRRPVRHDPRRSLRRSAAALALAAATLAACDPYPPPATPAPVSTPAAPTTPPAARITPRDLRKLRWIEGTWRSTGVNQPAFYDRYRFADDSTLIVEAFADSTFITVTDSTRFELRAGTLRNASTFTRWVASRLDERSVEFVPVGSRNTITWRYESADRWTALLHWPASATHPARDVTYQMERRR